MDEVVFNETDGVEYDPLYNEILLLLSGHDNSDGPLDAPAGAEVINWTDIRGKCERLLAVCKDLRVIMWHLRASLHIQGVVALYQSIQLIDELLRSGAVVYPHIPDEPAGSSHAAALGWLGNGCCLSELKQARLATDITVTFEVMMQALAQDGASVMSFSQMVLVLENSSAYYQSQGCPALPAQLALCAEALTRIEQYANQCSDDYQLDCRALRQLLVGTGKLLNDMYAETASEYSASEEPAKEDIATAMVVTAGKIKSRQDAILMLDKVVEYFKTHEPSHPAPIFIRRTQKMIGMEFEAIIEDLIPEATATLAAYIGKERG
ncbi:type VI secretion system ImpA family N-terminal domain-containing protein [Enterobacter asburiae]|uniref:type VI secretion system protein TssA n=1 Tax=Scandinavium sp. UTDF21-P1B TaxID=3446379 RepID=UPI00346FB1B0